MKIINKKGFTLIELLAVIVILAVVMVVTIPSVLNAMSGAKITQLNNASETVSKWLTKKYEMANLDYELSSQEDVVYNNFESKMGAFPSSYSDAGYTGKDLNSCGNSNSTYCRAESIAMLEAAGISDPENNIDLENSYIWIENNKLAAKLTAKENGSFYTNVENASSNSNSRLPDGYREVRYLVFSGDDYVSTNIYLTGNNTVRLKYEIDSTAINQYVFGYYDAGDSASSYSLYIGKDSDGSGQGLGSFRYGTKNGTNNTNLYNNNTVANFDSTMFAGTKYDVIISPSSGIKINNNNSVKPWNNAASFTCVNPMYIGGSLDGSGAVRTGKFIGKMFEFKVDGVFDGVPAVRESDSNAGYYDLVTNTFFPSTGTLTAAY